MSESIERLDAERLMELLSRQRELYLGLRSLSDRQGTLITGDQPELLLNILRDRQQYVTALAENNRQLAPYRQNWSEVYGSLPEAQRERASALLEEINGMLSIILETDKRDSALLSARKQSVSQSLQNLSDGRSANQAYAIQAGREIRVFVKPHEVSDIEAEKLAKDIAGRIEQELRYPGEIKVTLVRENRFVEYAR